MVSLFIQILHGIAYLYATYVRNDRVSDVTVVIPIVDVIAAFDRVVAETGVDVYVTGGVGVRLIVPWNRQVHSGPLRDLAVVIRGVGWKPRYNNMLHLTLIHQMACCEQSEYRIAVKALQILYFCHLLLSVQYQNFVSRVILLQYDNHSRPNIRLKTKLWYCTLKW